MTKSRKQIYLQAGLCLICAFVEFLVSYPLEGSEFQGGAITGPLYYLSTIGGVLFLLGVGLTFFYRRFAALIALAACLCCLPLYLYFTMPGPFRAVFKGRYSVAFSSSFVWNTWAMAGILAIILMVVVGLQSFKTHARSQSNQ